MDFLIGAAVLWVAPLFVAYSVGRSRGREGLWYALFLGWIGVLVLLMLPPRRDAATGYRECPFCKSSIRVDASVCPQCQRDVEPIAATMPNAPSATAVRPALKWTLGLLVALIVAVVVIGFLTR